MTMKNSLLTPQVRELALSYMEALSCPRSLTIAILLRYEQWEAIMKMKLKPVDYLHARQYRRAAAATAFLSKLECRIDGLDPDGAAIDAWWQAEKNCFKANQYIYHLLSVRNQNCDDHEGAMLRFLDMVKKQVASIIGAAPPALVEGRFGPGATRSDKSGCTTVPHKLSSTPTYTSSALYHLVPWTGTLWSAASAARGDKPTLVRGNRFFTVPKKATISRGCATEPSVNAFYQRGYGRVISSRLARAGIVLSKQRKVNDRTYDGQRQRNLFWHLRDLDISSTDDYVASELHALVAQEASASNKFATIDLSMASDTICRALVEAVLPDAWFEVLSDLRSPTTLIPQNGTDVIVHLEKFSSMGNGFTFELETTIFLALAMALRPTLQPGKDVFVFGDDIIVPTDMAQTMVLALRALGFSPNVDKTFLEGPFRESCGGDFWDGEPVRPYYLKELPNEPQDFIAMANGVRRLALQDSGADRVNRDFRSAWFRILDCIPANIRKCRGPSSLGDLVIHDISASWQRKYRQQKGYIRVYRPIKPPTVCFGRFDPDVQLAAVTYGIRFTNLQPPDPKRAYDCRLLPMRGDVGGYKVGWVPFG